MSFFVILSLVLTVFYAVIMTIYLSAWKRTESILIRNEASNLSVSIIIPVRNEEASIGLLIQDLLNQDYPKDLLEIIIVDDYSEDRTVEIVESFDDNSIHLIQLSQIDNHNNLQNAYKKRAIEIGIQSSKNEIIITTDGDCRVPKKWISTLISIKKQSRAKLLTGAVIMTGTETLFTKFQALDFLGMMGITAAMLRLNIFNMANGANLLFEKEAFVAVDGFKDINHIASGDDMLLMYKIAKKYNNQVAFAKHPDAVVYTETMPTISGFLQQRFRWTAKSKDYQDRRMTWILGLVFLFVASLLANLILAIFFHSLIYLVLIQLATKSLVDYRLLNSTSIYYNKNELMKTFISSQIFHIIYIVFVGSLGNILKFEWKGRRLKK